MHSVGRKVAKARVLKRNLGQRADQREWQSPGFIVVSNTRAELSRTIFSRDEVRGYLTLCAVVTCFAPSVHAACLTRSVSTWKSNLKALDFLLTYS